MEKSSPLMKRREQDEGGPAQALVAGAALLAIVERWWDRGERCLAQAFMAGAALLVIVEVLARYFFHFSLFWIEEYTRYFVIGAVLTGASNLVRTDGHVALSLLRNRVSARRKAIMDLSHGILGGFVSMVILIGGMSMVKDAWVMGYESEAVNPTPLWLPYLLVVLGGGLMTASWIWKILQVKNLSWRSARDPFTYIFIVSAAGGVLLFFGTGNATVALFLGLIWFTVLGLPIAFALGLTTTLAVFGFHLGPSIVVASRGFWQMNSFTLLAIPFFTLAASAMVNSRLGRDVFEFATAAIGHVRGGMGIAVALAAALFAAMSGSTVANAAALGALAFPMLLARGYPPALAAGLLGAAGTIAPLIPPSGHMVLYGAITQQSVGDLLMAGVLPGLCMAAGLAIYTYIASLRGGFDKDAGDFSFKRLLGASRKCIWAVLMPVIILGVIYLGIASPTESAAIAALYGFLVTGLVYRSLTGRVATAILQGCVDITAMIFMIIMFSGVFGFVMADQQIPQLFVEWITISKMQGWQFMLMTILIFFILGFVMGPAAITIIIIPILVPLLEMYKYNLIQFGVVSTVILETAFLTPPVGTVLYVIARVCKIEVEQVIKGVWPFVVILLVITLIFAFVPELSLLFVRSR